MSWIGVNDFQAPSLTPNAGRPTLLGRAERDPNLLIPRGSLVLETRGRDDNDGTVLLSYSDKGDWAFTLDVTILSGGELCLAIQQGPTICKTTMSMPAIDAEARLRITLTWDAPARTGLLSFEDLDTALIKQVELDAPPPMRAKALAELSLDGEHQWFDDEITLFAVSDAIEPVGLMPGLARGTRVETEHGPMLVENLRRGDLVRTGEGELAPIRWLTTRDVPRAGFFAPITLRAPFFGLDHDLKVAQDHRVVVSGTEAEYLFGNDTVLVEARHLLSSNSATTDTRPGLQRFYHLLLDNHEVIHTNGAWSESLFVGRLASAGALLATTPLADLPLSAMPRHTAIASPSLREFETVALVSALTA